MLAKVSVSDGTALLTSITPPAAPRVRRRSVDAATPLKLRAPPSRTRLAALPELAPTELGRPPLRIDDTFRIPPWTTVRPV